MQCGSQVEWAEKKTRRGRHTWEKEKVMMTLVGVMGPGEGATHEDMRIAYELGGLIAQQGWVLVTGGRNAGVMDAAGRGAKAAHGLVVGILPGMDCKGMSAAVDIPIVTGINEARNFINVLSGRVLFFVGMNPGTASEMALALKCRQPAILVNQRETTLRFFAEMSASELVHVSDAAAAIAGAQRFFADASR
jgi:uncharacterized protein (TIGR00725 family)